MGTIAPTHINLGCGPHRAPPPYLNIDCHADEVVKPDLIVPSETPLAGFEDGSVEILIASHVLEHVPWNLVPSLVAEMRRVLQPDGRLCVVGPDTYRTIQRWHEGLEPWWLVQAVLENSGHYQESQEEWPEARHHWNATGERTAKALEAGGFKVEAVELDSPILEDFFVVSRAPWQFALVATCR